MAESKAGRALRRSRLHAYPLIQVPAFLPTESRVWAGCSKCNRNHSQTGRTTALFNRLRKNVAQPHALPGAPLS